MTITPYRKPEKFYMKTALFCETKQRCQPVNDPHIGRLPPEAGRA